MPFYPAPGGDVRPGPVCAPASARSACRCCPGGISRSTRARRYPSDMTEMERVICEPLLPAPASLAGRGGRPSRYCTRGMVDAIRGYAGKLVTWAKTRLCLTLEVVRRPMTCIPSKSCPLRDRDGGRHPVLVARQPAILASLAPAGAVGFPREWRVPSSRHPHDP